MSSNIQQRRPVNSSSVHEPSTLAPNTGPSDTTPLVAAGVIRTLLLFTAAMVICPIGSYFVTVNTIFRGNSTFAGGFAAFMANVVLIGYIVVAWREDDGDHQPGPGVVSGGQEAKKEK